MTDLFLDRADTPARSDVVLQDGYPRVAVIVLMWNGWEVTVDCLESLRRIDYPNYKVVAVDNASTDGSEERIKIDFPEVELIRNIKNLGFAAGNNVAIARALQGGADYILLLNNDTIVSPEFLARMITVAESDRKIGILNPKILYFDNPRRIWYAGGTFNLWQGFARHTGQRAFDGARYGKTRDVTFITGCAFLIKAEVIRKIGLLDDRFFMVCEDTDWSLRALKAGYKAVYVADSHILHRESYTIRHKVGKSIRDYHNVRSSMLLMKKHAKLYHWPWFLVSLTFRLAARSGAYIVFRQFDRLRALYRGLFHGLMSSRTSSRTNELAIEPALKSEGQ